MQDLQSGLEGGAADEIEGFFFLVGEEGDAGVAGLEEGGEACHVFGDAGGGGGGDGAVVGCGGGLGGVAMSAQWFDPAPLPRETAHGLSVWGLSDVVKVFVWGGR